MIEIGISEVLGALAWTYIVFRFGMMVGRNRRARMDLSGPPATPKPPRPVPANVNAEARTALTAGNKIEAIKLVREATGMGLKESKEYVERLERE